MIKLIQPYFRNLKNENNRVRLGNNFLVNFVQDACFLNHGMCIVVQCPTGTKLGSGTCIQCDIGSYQDQAGRKSCIPCPGGLTTRTAGSNREADCIGMRLGYLEG